MNITRNDFEEIIIQLNIKERKAQKYLFKLLNRVSVKAYTSIDEIAFNNNFFAFYYKEKDNKKCIIIDYLNKDKDLAIITININLIFKDEKNK